MLRNLLFRIQQYAHDNRARLIRAGAYALVGFVILAMSGIAIERALQRRYENRIQTLESQRQAAEDKAAAAEDRAAKLGYEIEARKAELAEIEKRADAADAALRNARGRTITLKEQYETIRYVTIPADIPVSVADACTELSRLGYRCE